MKQTFMSDLNIKLIKKRRQLKLNQKEMAERLGISRGVYAYWETGRTPGIDNVGRICDVLEISPNVLFDWSDND